VPRGTDGVKIRVGREGSSQARKLGEGFGAENVGDKGKRDTKGLSALKRKVLHTVNAAIEEKKGISTKCKVVRKSDRGGKQECDVVAGFKVLRVVVKVGLEAGGRRGRPGGV